MGDEVPSIILNQLLDAIRTVSDRLTRLEALPHPIRGEPVRNAQQPRQQREEETDNDMFGLDNDPPLATNLNPWLRRRESARTRDMGEDQPRNGGKDVKLTAPVFIGWVNLNWEKRME